MTMKLRPLTIRLFGRSLRRAAQLRRYMLNKDSYGKEFKGFRGYSCATSSIFLCMFGCGLLMEYFFPINLISLSLIPRVVVGGAFLLISSVFPAISQ
jgi:hypothetical protein